MMQADNIIMYKCHKKINAKLSVICGDRKYENSIIYLSKIEQIKTDITTDKLEKLESEIRCKTYSI